MPWRVTMQEREREKFVRDFETGCWSMTELCLRYGVSRKTGYKYWKRYEEEGLGGLADRRRARKTFAHRLTPEVVAEVLVVKKDFPHWGARKLRDHLFNLDPERKLPAESTIHDLLVRHGLVNSHARRRRHRHPGKPIYVADKPNAVWTVDFKGQFRTQDHIYCYPLTIADLYSRFFIACQALLSTKTVEAWPVFERRFREFGLPDAILSDNGVPFCSASAVDGLCQFSAWLTMLGIKHLRTVPGNPQQNGVHERRHRTLKEETTVPPSVHLEAQQKRFNAWRLEYNEVRPHEALDGKTPSSLYAPSLRPYPKRFEAPSYPDHFLKRRVSEAGTFRFKGANVFITQAISGHDVGLEEVENGIWSIYFYDRLLTRYNERIEFLEK